MRILCVEDNVKTNTTLRSFLTSKGHEFIGEIDGKHGLQLIREQQFDVVLLDLTLTGPNLADLLTVLMLNGSLKNQTIIAMTAHPVSDEEKDLMLKSGIYAILHKPFDPETLLETINNLQDRDRELKLRMV